MLKAQKKGLLSFGSILLRIGYVREPLFITCVFKSIKIPRALRFSTTPGCGTRILLCK